jgi:lipopolysaccharide export system permease protein
MAQQGESRMKQVDRYILGHFLHILALTLTTCISIYLLVDFLEKLGRFIKYQAVVKQYLGYFFNSIPMILVHVMPLVILMSVVLTIGSLGRSNEITAMRACGISLGRIIRPIILATIIIALGFLLINELLAPVSARQLTRLVEYQLRGRPEPSLNSDRIWYRDGNRIINITLAQPEKKILQGTTIFELDNNFRLRRRLQIPVLSYAQDHWLAKSLKVRSFAQDSGDPETSFQLKDQSLDIGRQPEDFIRAAEQHGFKNAFELWQSSTKLEAEGLDTTRLNVDLQARIAAPFTCLVMAFLGVPFSLGHGRGSSVALGIGLSLGVGVGYFLLSSIASALGYSGALSPFASGWAANIIFLLLGIYLVLKSRD